MMHDLIDKITVIFSRKGRGKSWLGRFLIDQNRDRFHAIIVIAPTGFNSFWQGVVGEGAVHNGYDPSFLTALLKHQQKRGPDGSFNWQKRKIMIVMDDCLSEVNFKAKGSPLLQLVTSNRHFGISLMVMTQGVSAVPPILRTNADLAYMLRTNAEGSRDLLFGDYGTGRKADWLEELDSATRAHGGYGYFLYDQSADQYSSGVAEDVPNRYKVSSRSRTAPQCCLIEAGKT